MLLAYLSTDEVNLALAAELAHLYGFTLCPVEPRDPLPGEEFDALLYDWDFWPDDRRRGAQADLLAGPACRPVALHGYNLCDGQAESLRRNGVVICTSLAPALFHHLRQAVLAARVAAARGEGAIDLGPDRAEDAA
jgi:hypothetical protein